MNKNMGLATTSKVMALICAGVAMDVDMSATMSSC